MTRAGHSGKQTRSFAFDPDFLRVRAWPVVALWIGSFAIMLAVIRLRRQSVLTRRPQIFALAANGR
ncbi:MAG: hypothetical protein ABIO75_06980 [Thermomonas sp.]